MIQFKIKNRFSGGVQFTAEIDCDQDAPASVKIGLAVKWALENGANLNGASLNGADLYRADLYKASLNGADLYRADLNGADLAGADLAGADLAGADLAGANLYNANLYGANLYNANLYGANLNGANLNGANLYGVSGVNDWIKCIQIDQYPITYTADIMQIGCQRHLISAWAEFNDARILEMDGKAALRFWRKYKDWIFQTIDLCPAKPAQT